MPSQLNPDALTDLSNVLELLQNVPADKHDRIERLINAYSRAIHNYTGRRFAPAETAADAKRYTYDGLGYLNLEPFEARTVTGVTFQSAPAAATAVAAAEWRPEPLEKTDEDTYLWLALLTPASALTGVQLSSVQIGRYIVEVTGLWGAASIPEDVALACEIAVANAYRNPEGFASRSVGSEYGFQEVSEPEAPGLALPRDARYLLGPYRRPRARMTRPARTTA